MCGINSEISFLYLLTGHSYRELILLRIACVIPVSHLEKNRSNQYVFSVVQSIMLCLGPWQV